MTLALLLPAPCLADEVLQGRIEKANARVNRPAMPSKPLGDALDHISAGKHSRAGFDLTASSVANLLDKHAFDFSQNAFEGQNSKLGASASESSTQPVDSASDRELVIAWEAWHKRLCEHIYHHWLSLGRVPGEGVVVLHVTRDGKIDYDLQDFHTELFDESVPEQRMLFDECVGETLKALNHKEVLPFPARSRRTEVFLSTRFSFRHGDGPSGYNWKKGDYERVDDSK